MHSLYNFHSLQEQYLTYEAHIIRDRETLLYNESYICLRLSFITGNTILKYLVRIIRATLLRFIHSS